MDDAILLSPDQGVRLMALWAAIRAGDLSFRGHEQEDEETARSLLKDVGEEIALQLGGAQKEPTP